MTDPLAIQLLARLDEQSAEIRRVLGQRESRRLRVRDVARLLGISTRSVWRLVERDIIPPGIGGGKGSARTWAIEDLDRARGV